MLWFITLKNPMPKPQSNNENSFLTSLWAVWGHETKQVEMVIKINNHQSCGESFKDGVQW